MRIYASMPKHVCSKIDAIIQAYRYVLRTGRKCENVDELFDLIEMEFCDLEDNLEMIRQTCAELRKLAEAP